MELLQKHFDIALETPDGINKLRKFVLTLAMQGKLVLQDPKDQSASELLKEIEAEKKRLVKDGKIRNQEAFAPIADGETSFELPIGWLWVRLGVLGETQTGTTPPKKDPSNEGNFIPFIGPGDIASSKINYNNKGLSENGLKNGRLIKKHSVLMVCIGGSIGKTAINEMDVACNQQINTITPFIRDSYRVIFYTLTSPDFQRQILDLAGGSATPIINKQKWSSIPVPLPPIAEQKRIVAKIDQLMALCDKLETERNGRDNKRLNIHTAVINGLLSVHDKSTFISSQKFIAKNFSELYSISENVEGLKKAILQLAVMGKLVPQDYKDQPANELLKEIEAEKKRLVKEGKIKRQEPLPEIKSEEISYEVPRGWEWARLNDVLDVRDGTHDTPKYVETGYPLITSKNLYTGTLSFDDVKFISEEDHLKIKERSSVGRGDILFAMIGSIGNPVIVDCDDDFSIKNVALFKYYRKGAPDTKYIYYYLLYVQERMKVISSGAVQSFVSLGFLRNYLFPLPPLAEQKRIVAKIDQLMSLCNTLEHTLKNASNKQTAILNAVLAKL